MSPIKHNLKRKQWQNYILIATSLMVFIGGGLLIWISTFDIPTLENFEERKVTQSTKIYDKTGEILLYDVFNNVKRTVVPFEDISEYAKQAAIAIEDQAFYEHDGVRVSSFIRAVFANILSLEFSQGGSTITQQAVKNSLLTSDKLISRKLKEWVLAVKIEKILTKDEILSLYLNEIPYGGSIYGIEEASNAFFAKSSSELTIPEAAYLAAIPQAPTFFSPYGEHRDRLDARKNLVLREMRDMGFITEEEYEEAKITEVIFQPRSDTGIKAPHFVIYIREYLEEKYGSGVLENGGLRVITTLDYELQEKAEELALKHALTNSETYDAENIALVATDPKTGGILAMVGSRNYFDEDIDGNFNVALAHRQPGSAFKPFAYTAAFEKGYTPNTILFDLPTQFSTSCSPEGVGTSCYTPGNYDDIFRGPMTMRDALAQSVNVPAVKTLYLAGMRNTIDLARRMGIEDLDDYTQYGLTLVLGGGEVRLIDMVGAYGVFANEGIRNPIHGILEVRDLSGKILEEHEPKEIPVLDKNIALITSDVLSDNIARTPAFGANSFLNIPGYDVAVKTGTTNDYRDAWIIGYSPNISVGAWAGNNDNRSMDKRVAGFIIAPFWNEFMRFALTKVPNEQFEEPIINTSFNIHPLLRGKWQGSEYVVIDRISGKLATEFTPEQTKGEILYGEIKSIISTLNRNNPQEKNLPVIPDAQQNLWDVPIKKWLNTQNFKENLNPNIPTEKDDVHTADSRPQVRITNPVDKSFAGRNDLIEVRLDIESSKKISKVDYRLNGKIIGTLTNEPFIFTFKPSDFGVTEIGPQSLSVTVYDDVLNTTIESIVFNVNQ